MAIAAVDGLDVLVVLSVSFCIAVIFVCVTFEPFCDLSFEMEPMILETPNNATQVPAEISNIFRRASRRVAFDGMFDTSELTLLSIPTLQLWCQSSMDDRCSDKCTFLVL